MVSHATAAVVARAAGDHGVERNPITLADAAHTSANLVYHASNFVSWHERKDCTKMTAVQMQIRAANTCCGNPNAHLASANFGRGQFSGLEVVFFGDYGGTHGFLGGLGHYFTAPIVKPCTSWRCADQPNAITGKITRVAAADNPAQNNPSEVLKALM